jgi:hypothetical protein
MAVLYIVMGGIRKHYDSVAEELDLGEDIAGAEVAVPGDYPSRIVIRAFHSPSKPA